jgi:hypothetical protein
MRKRRRRASVVLMRGILRMPSGDNRRLLGRQGQATTDKGHHFKITKYNLFNFCPLTYSFSILLQDYELKFKTSDVNGTR